MLRKRLLDNSKVYVGIDNGVSGSVAIIGCGTMVTTVQPIPTKSEQSYTKTRQMITRVDVPKLKKMLEPVAGWRIMIVMERPLVNPGRFKATGSALRCLEAVLIALEDLKLPYQYVDSKEWQRKMLPKGTEKEDLKKVSLEIGKRLFPGIDFGKLKDADALLMAEWARRIGL